MIRSSARQRRHAGQEHPTQPTRWWPRWLLTGIALVCGCAVGLGFAPYNCWWLVPLGLAGLVSVCLLSTTKVGLLRGYVFGLGLAGVAFPWIGVLGIAILSVFIAYLALWYAIFGLVVAATRRTPVWGFAGAATWMVIEWVSSRWPMGGFGWGNLSYTAADAPVNGLFPWISTTGVSLVILTSGFLLAWMIRPLIEHRSIRAWRPVSVILTAAVLVVSGSAGLAGRSYDPAPDSGSVTVAVVQGNVPGTGIEALGPIYTVENNHLSETILLAAKIRTGQAKQPDFVLWPENSTATDPLQDQRTAQIVNLALDLSRAPVLVGSITLGPGPDQRATTALWYTPDQGVTATYQKRNLVPFGEWIPARSVMLKLIPMLNAVGAQSIPGTNPGVLNVSTDSGPLRVGILICFEVSYDTTFDQMITGDQATGGGAQVVTVQTSNAMFTGSDQMSQQDQITRIRAMESRREILVATTNSLAGLINSKGQIVYEAKLGTSDSQVFTVPLRTTITPAVAFGGWIDLSSVVLPLIGCLVVGLVSRRRRVSGLAGGGIIDPLPTLEKP